MHLTFQAVAGHQDSIPLANSPQFFSFSMLCIRQYNRHCPWTFFCPRKLKRLRRLFAPILAKHRVDHGHAMAVYPLALVGVVGESGLRRQACFNAHDRHLVRRPSKKIFVCPCLSMSSRRSHRVSPAGQVQVFGITRREVMPVALANRMIFRRMSGS